MQRVCSIAFPIFDRLSQSLIERTYRTSVPARNRTWSTSFAGSRANPAHSRDVLFSKYLARESNPVLWFRRPPCVPHTRKADCRVARPGVEPGPTASEAVMRSGTTTGQVGPNHTRSRRLDSHQHHSADKADAFLSRATSAVSTKGERRELNPYLLVHNQACRTATPRTPCRAEGAGFEPARHLEDAQPASNRTPSPIGWPFRFFEHSAARPGFEPGTSR